MKEEFEEKFITNKPYYQTENGIVYWSDLWTWIEQQIKQARIEEHKQTVLYWETLPPNEIYNIYYHFNRIKELEGAK